MTHSDESGFKTDI